MDISSLFQHLGIALGLGLLVGLQRESAASSLAGVRTFPLGAVLGTVCGLLSQAFGGWILAAGVIALVVIIYIGKIRATQAITIGPLTRTGFLVDDSNSFAD